MDKLDILNMVASFLSYSQITGLIKVSLLLHCEGK